jgi:hypothetical protein
MKQDRTIPGAILLGSIIIALGLYFGLNKGDKDDGREERELGISTADRRASAAERGAEAQVGNPGRVGPPSGGQGDSPPAAPPVAPMVGAPMGGPIGGGLGMPAVSTEVRARVQASAAKAFEVERENFRKACWEPALKENPEPATSKFVFNVTFDGATGKEISRGVNELRGESRSDVAQCLRRQPIGVGIEPEGVNVNIDVPISFP